MVLGYWCLILLCAMKIEELEDAEYCREERERYERQIVSVDAKRALVGAGARILFYPTLLYNVLRNKMEAEFRWWDQIDEVLLSLHLVFQISLSGFIVLKLPYLVRMIFGICIFVKVELM